MKISYVGQIFGTRKIIKDYCDDDDWRFVKKIPKRKSDYCLGECLVCGRRLPVDVNVLRRFPPKRCGYCSGVGNRFSDGNRNTWAVYQEYAAVNIPFHNQVVTAYVSLCDYEKCKARVWRISQKRNKYYVVSGSKTRRDMVYMHQLIMGKPQDGFEIDHIDGNSLNNMRENLRFLTRSENARSVGVRIDSTIGIRGVSKDRKSGKYMVDFAYCGTRFYTKPMGSIAEAVFCRYCFERHFNLDIITRNHLLGEYNTLSEDEKEKISKYVDQVILEKLEKSKV